MKKHFRLPEPFLTEWKTTLKSGKYNQGNGMLFTTQEYEDYDETESFEEEPIINENSTCLYCCLGVAGEVVGFDRHEMFTRELFDFGEPIKKEELKKVPDELVVSNGPANELVNILSSLNDGISASFIKEKLKKFPELSFKKQSTSIQSIYSFEEIAEWLDDNVEGYTKEDENG